MDVRHGAGTDPQAVVLQPKATHPALALRDGLRGGLPLHGEAAVKKPRLRGAGFCLGTFSQNPSPWKSGG